jgi:hypothetical protein
MWFGCRVFRAIAAVAIVAMVNLTVHPLVVAMNMPKPAPTWQTTRASPDRQLMYLIDDVRATLMSPTDSVMRKEFNPKAALEKFDVLTEKIRASMQAEREAAAATNTSDAAALAKLDNLKQQFDARSQIFRSKLQDMVPQGLLFKSAKSDGTDLAKWLDEVSPLKAPEDFSEMPFQLAKADPKNVPRDFEGESRGSNLLLANVPSLPLTGEGQGERTPKNAPLPFVGEGLGERGLELFAKNASFTDSQYLGSKAEAEITADIRARATALGNNALNIYNWVRNNIEWQPTWGGQQTADMTLDVKRGNAMDIATLTIALLRAANIPARYVHGTVDIPPDQLMNMAGDFENIDAAMDFVADSGTPVTEIYSGNNLKNVRIEHVWVEAALPYFPSQGTRPVNANNPNNPIDTWVSIDPSYKQYDYLIGLDANAIIDIDGEQLANNFIGSGAVNEQEGWVQGLNGDIIVAVQEQAQQKLEAHINGMQDPTVGDVIGGRTIRQHTHTFFPSNLPYYRVTRGNAYSELPDSLRVRVFLGLDWDRFSFGYKQSKTMPLYQLNQRSITISFKPATAADENALKALIPENLTDLSQLPSFLPSSIRVIPEIKRDNEVLLTSNALALGEEIDTGYRFITPTQTYLDKRDSIIAGSYLALGIVGSNPSVKTIDNLKANLEQTKQILEAGTSAQKEALTRERLFGDKYVAGIQMYYSQYVTQGAVMGLKFRTMYQAIPMAGTFGYEPSVRTLFGLNRGIEAQGVYMNVRTSQAIKDCLGDNEKAKQLMLLAGMQASALEHSVPEQLYTDPNSAAKPEGFSTVKAIGLAMAQGQKIYTINQQNQATALSALRLDSLAMSEIRDALAAGKEVMTHTDQLTIPGFRGSGFAITDPVTGGGAYKISGGKNGGFLDDLKGLWEELINYVNAELLSNILDKFKKGLGNVFGMLVTAKDAWDALKDCKCEWYKQLVIFDSILISLLVAFGVAAVCVGGSFLCAFALGIAVSFLLDRFFKALWEYAAESSLCKS